MMKLRTQVQLQDFLDTELGWRVKEIADMKSAVKQSRYLSEKTVVRAALALLYAHWEGFVKCAVTGYVSYVNYQGLTYAELRSCFVVFGLKKALHDLAESRKAAGNIAAIDFVRDQLNERAQLNLDKAVNTESNLSSMVLGNILLSVGIDPSPYESRYHLIDERLLKRRNNIAHGDYLEVTRDDWAGLCR
ncbi:MAE_28990/MAE_18760 family HEPN-like nuclease [Cupriavidus basilensis]